MSDGITRAKRAMVWPKCPECGESGWINMGLEEFKGNILTGEEKQYRLKTYYEEKKEGYIDKAITPFLEMINEFPFIMTTQSCCGHGEDIECPEHGRRAHIDFRCMLSVEDTIDKILRPFTEKHYHSVSCQLMMECDRLRYCLWIDNDRWKQQLADLLDILRDVDGAGDV